MITTRSFCHDKLLYSSASERIKLGCLSTNRSVQFFGATSGIRPFRRRKEAILRISVGFSKIPSVRYLTDVTSFCSVFGEIVKIGCRSLLYSETSRLCIREVKQIREEF